MKTLLLTGAVLLLVLSFKAGAGNPWDSVLPPISMPETTSNDFYEKTMEDLRRQQERDIYIQRMTDADNSRRMHSNYCNTITANDRAQQACFNSQW